MKYFGEALGEKHKELSKIIRKQIQFEQARALFLEIHAGLHRSEVSGTELNEVDRLLADLKDWEYAVMPAKRDETIAWVLWHIARIEDLTMGILTAGQEQLFDDEWQKKLGVSYRDTGNAFSDPEIIELSHSVDISQLLNYRDEVGRRTRTIVGQLTAADMQRRVRAEDLEQIRLAGGVTGHPDSAWLLEFWGGKTVAGLLLMPPTRHVILHLNACCRWKEQIRTRNKFYLR